MRNGWQWVLAGSRNSGSICHKRPVTVEGSTGLTSPMCCRSGERGLDQVAQSHQSAPAPGVAQTRARPLRSTQDLHTPGASGQGLSKAAQIVSQLTDGVLMLKANPRRGATVPIT